jgi:hypothetical protein
MQSSVGDALQSPEQLRKKAETIKRTAALTTDSEVAAELIRLAHTYLRDAAKIERAARRAERL